YSSSPRGLICATTSQLFSINARNRRSLTAMGDSALLRSRLSGGVFGFPPRDQSGGVALPRMEVASIVAEVVLHAAGEESRIGPEKAHGLAPRAKLPEEAVMMDEHRFVDQDLDTEENGHHGHD